MAALTWNVQGLPSSCRFFSSLSRQDVGETLSANSPHNAAHSAKRCFCSSKVTSSMNRKKYPSTTFIPGTSRFAIRSSIRMEGNRRNLLVRARLSQSDPYAGVSLYKPASYDVLLDDVCKGLLLAVEEGKIRLEVDFPPLPSTRSSYEGSSDEYIDANIQLALALASKLNKAKGLNICLVVPDKVERRRTARLFRSALEMASSVSLGCLEDAPGNGGSGVLSSIRSALDLDFGEGFEDKFQPTTAVDLFMAVNLSTNELPALETFAATVASDKPLLLFNLELETLRADLGLFGFPSRDLQYRFLSQFLSVFYIRQRDYSKSVNVAPFILNYSGALFRLYPGPWQVMVRQSDGSYACVAEAAERFTLGQTKEELNLALGLNTEEEGSALAFLRRGYKTSTWWEDDVALEQHSTWRS